MDSSFVSRHSRRLRGSLLLLITYTHSFTHLRAEKRRRLSLDLDLSVLPISTSDDRGALGVLSYLIDIRDIISSLGEPHFQCQFCSAVMFPRIIYHSSTKLLAEGGKCEYTILMIYSFVLQKC